MSSTLRYLLSKDDGSWSRPRGRRRTQTLLRIRLARHKGPWQIARRNRSWGIKWHRLQKLMRRARVLLTESGPGEVLRIRCGDGYVVKVRIIDLGPHPANTPGTPDVDRFVAHLNQFFPGWRNGGICACRHVSHGGWSDHAWCAAIDVFASSTKMHEIANYAVAHAGELDVKYVIYLSAIWEPGLGWRAYHGERHYHVHVSFKDGGTGTPPCAR